MCRPGPAKCVSSCWCNRATHLLGSQRIWERARTRTWCDKRLVRTPWPAPGRTGQEQAKAYAERAVRAVVQQARERATRLLDEVPLLEVVKAEPYAMRSVSAAGAARIRCKRHGCLQASRAKRSAKRSGKGICACNVRQRRSCPVQYNSRTEGRSHVLARAQGLNPGGDSESPHATTAPSTSRSLHSTMAPSLRLRARACTDKLSW